MLRYGRMDARDVSSTQSPGDKGLNRNRKKRKATTQSTAMMKNNAVCEYITGAKGEGAGGNW